MSPTGPSRLGSSIAVLPAPVQSEPVKGTFLLCSKVTFSYCCDTCLLSCICVMRSLRIQIEFSCYCLCCTLLTKLHLQRPMWVLKEITNERFFTEAGTPIYLDCCMLFHRTCGSSGIHMGSI